MKSIGSFEAKTHLPELLRQAEAGETILVTRHGQPVAQIGPVVETTRFSPKEAMRRLRGLRLRLNLAELRELCDAGRRA